MIRLTNTAIEKAIRNSPTFAKLDRKAKIAWLRDAVANGEEVAPERLHTDVTSAITLTPEHLTDLGDRLAAVIEDDIASPGDRVVVTVKPYRSILQAPARIAAAEPVESEADVLRKRIADLEAQIAKSSPAREPKPLRVLVPASWFAKLEARSGGKRGAGSEVRRIVGEVLGESAAIQERPPYSRREKGKTTRASRTFLMDVEPTILAALRDNPTAGDRAIARIAGVTNTHVARVRLKNGIPARGKFNGGEEWTTGRKAA